TARGITHHLLVAKPDQAKLLASIQAGLPGARIEEAPAYLKQRPVFRAAGEFTLTSQVRPLNTDQAEATSAALLAALSSVGRCEAQVAWTFTGAKTPQPVRPATTDGNWLPYLLEGEPTADAEAVRALRQKHKGGALLQASLRIGVAGPTPAHAGRLLGRISPVFQAANNVGVRIVRRWLPAVVVA